MVAVRVRNVPRFWSEIVMWVQFNTRNCACTSLFLWATYTVRSSVRFWKARDSMLRSWRTLFSTLKQKYYLTALYQLQLMLRQMEWTGCNGLQYATKRTEKNHETSLILGRGHTKETGNRNATTISENCYQPELNTLLNGAAQFPQFALLHSVTCI
jgi:hypothetical protein